MITSEDSREVKTTGDVIRDNDDQLPEWLDTVDKLSGCISLRPRQLYCRLVDVQALLIVNIARSSRDRNVLVPNLHQWEAIDGGIQSKYLINHQFVYSSIALQPYHIDVL
jgi:hypothetical protein